VGPGGPFQREALADHGMQASGRRLGQGGAGQLDQLGGVGPEPADHGHPAGGRLLVRDGREGAAGGAEAAEPATLTQQWEGGGGDRPAHAVEGHVHAADLGPHPVRPARLQVVDAQAGAQPSGQLHLARAAGGGHHPGAGADGELDEQAAHAARRGLDQDGLAGPHLRRPRQPHRGAAVGQQRHGLGQPQALRDRDQAGGVHRHALRVAARPAGAGDHGDADQRPVHVPAHRGDPAADAVAEDRRQPRGHGGVGRPAGPDLGLDEGDAGERHLDDRLAGAREGIGQVRGDQGRGRPEVAQHHGSHRLDPLTRSPHHRDGWRVGVSQIAFALAPAEPRCYSRHRLSDGD
jgi:hypothetical protein